MEKDILFTGYTNVPSDYECPDGQLAQSYNLINEDGALHPLPQPQKLLQLPNGSKVLFIHTTAAYKHLIIHNTTNGQLSYIACLADKTYSEPIPLEGTYTDAQGTNILTSINAIGNTLVVLTTQGMRYYLFINNTYKHLGSSLPNVELSFGLKGNPRLWSLSPKSETDKTLRGLFNIDFYNIPAADSEKEWTDENQKYITPQIMAKVNKFLAEQSIDAGKFSMPFFVRYALRLYDGSLTCHSAPILLNPSTTAAPIVLVKHIKGPDDKNYTNADLDILLVQATINYMLLNSTNYNQLLQFSDIVKSVDVFISKPIYSYDQNGLCTAFKDTNNFETKFIGALNFQNTSLTEKQDNLLLPISLPTGQQIADIKNIYTEWTYHRLYTLYYSTNRTYPSYSVHLPEFEADKVTDTISNTSNFYLLKQIPLSELTPNLRIDIDVDKEYLQSLLAREVMTDDYLSNDLLMPTYAQAYNSRLNLAGITRQPFQGYRAETLFAYTNRGKIGFSIALSNRIELDLNILSFGTLNITTYINENNQTYQVQAQGAEIISDYRHFLDPSDNFGKPADKRSWGCYLFYPNINAYKMVLTDAYGSYNTDLKQHPFLNGAYAVIPYDMQRTPTTPYTKPATATVVDVPNKIYTSDVNNPFRFDVTNINTIGIGRIQGIASASKALSQGQFGQFPLYAFTTDGVWALEVSSTTGAFNAKQPITRDVCISSDSITQIDSSVLFATERGIMEISGASTYCLTDAINSPAPFQLSTLPGLASLYPQGLPQVDVPFAQYRIGSQIAYDYINQRILIFNPQKPYAYVYSFKSKQWGLMASSLTNVINAYPDAYAMANIDGQNWLVDLSHTNDATTQTLMVTRPIKLDAGSMLKTFRRVFLRGMFQKQQVGAALYASRDNVNWYLLYSAKHPHLSGFSGSPFKYFRIVSVATLGTPNNLVGASIEYVPKQTNRMH